MYKTTVVLYDDVKTFKTKDKIKIFFNNNFLCIEEGANVIFMARKDRVENVSVNEGTEEINEMINNQEAVYYPDGSRKLTTYGY